MEHQLNLMMHHFLPYESQTIVEDPSPLYEEPELSYESPVPANSKPAYEPEFPEFPRPEFSSLQHNIDKDAFESSKSKSV